MERGKRGQEHVLHQIRKLRIGTEHASEHAPHARCVALDQGRQSRTVAAPRREHEGSITLGNGQTDHGGGRGARSVALGVRGSRHVSLASSKDSGSKPPE
jgi:hypothetical protein